MEGEAQGGGGKSGNYQAYQNNLSAICPVEKMPDKRLGDAIDQKAGADRQGEREPAPPKLGFKWNYEYSEAASRSGGNESNEHRSGNDVPPVVYLSLPGAIRGTVDNPLDLAIDCGDASDYYEEKSGYQYQQADGNHIDAFIVRSA